MFRRKVIVREIEQEGLHPLSSERAALEAEIDFLRHSQLRINIENSMMAKCDHQSALGGYENVCNTCS